MGLGWKTVLLFFDGLDPAVPQHHLSKSAQGQLHWICGLRITTQHLLRILLDLLVDPFDDVRNTAVSVLEICLDSISEGRKIAALSMFPKFLQRVESMMLQSGRADQADGLARAYALLFLQCGLEVPHALRSIEGRWTQQDIFGHLATQLEDTIEVARTDLSSAVDGRPVHGSFAALR